MSSLPYRDTTIGAEGAFVHPALYRCTSGVVPCSQSRACGDCAFGSSGPFAPDTICERSLCAFLHTESLSEVGCQHQRICRDDPPVVPTVRRCPKCTMNLSIWYKSTRPLDRNEPLCAHRPETVTAWGQVYRTITLSRAKKNGLSSFVR